MIFGYPAICTVKTFRTTCLPSTIIVHNLKNLEPMIGIWVIHVWFQFLQLNHYRYYVYDCFSTGPPVFQCTCYFGYRFFLYIPSKLVFFFPGCITFWVYFHCSDNSCYKKFSLCWSILETQSTSVIMLLRESIVPYPVTSIFFHSFDSSKVPHYLHFSSLILRSIILFC